MYLWMSADNLSTRVSVFLLLEKKTQQNNFLKDYDKRKKEESSYRTLPPWLHPSSKKEHTESHQPFLWNPVSEGAEGRLS